MKLNHHYCSNTQKKKMEKPSAGSPDESRKLQVWGGGPLIKQLKLAAHRTKPGPGPRLEDQGRQQRTRNRRTRPKPGNLTHPCAKRGGGYIFELGHIKRKGKHSAGNGRQRTPYKQTKTKTARNGRHRSP